MNDRDALAEFAWVELAGPGSVGNAASEIRYSADQVADIAIAAGWRPPARTLTGPTDTELLAARARIMELEADHARLVEDVAATVRRFSATLDERDALRTRVEELESADREHSQLIEYLHYAHGIEIDREDDDFQEWQQQYGEVTELPED